MEVTPHTTDIVTFGTGCFWCTEAVFQELKGVEKVVPGYMGGQVADPTYEAVCSASPAIPGVCRLALIQPS